jgi:drug/metabolite transporter (DMT)-like permease
MYALASAFCWAVAAIVYKRISEQIKPLAIACAKSLVAILFLSPLFFLRTDIQASVFDYILLLVSGLLGIAAGDTLFFVMLKKNGVRVAVLWTLLIPVVTAIAGWIFLQERLNLRNWSGIFLTVCGLIWVLSFTVPKGEHTRSQLNGLLIGLVMITVCSAAIIVSKMILERVSPLYATYIRSLGASGGMLFIGLFSRKLVIWGKECIDKKVAIPLLFASIVGAVAGTWLCLLGLKYCDAGIATTLNSTVPIFAVLLTWILYKERITVPIISGSIIAVIGIYFLVAG